MVDQSQRLVVGFIFLTTLCATCCSKKRYRRLKQATVVKQTFGGGADIWSLGLNDLDCVVAGKTNQC